MTYHREPVVSRCKTVVNVIATTLTRTRKVGELVGIYVPCVLPGTSALPIPSGPSTVTFDVVSVASPFFEVAVVPTTGPVVDTTRGVSFTPIGGSLTVMSTRWSTTGPTRVTGPGGGTRVSNGCRPCPVAPAAGGAARGEGVPEVGVFMRFGGTWASAREGATMTAREDRKI